MYLCIRKPLGVTQTCHHRIVTESKTAATILWLHCFHLLTSNYSTSERWSPCNVACCLGKKIAASEWNTSECNKLSRKWKISVLCNIHLLTQYPWKMTPIALPRQACLNTYSQCTRGHPSCLLMKQPARKKHVRHLKQAVHIYSLNLCTPNCIQGQLYTLRIVIYCTKICADF